MLDLNTPKIMGIINCSPDSFYSGSRFSGLDAVLKKADELIDNGADILDIGGHSTRPNAPYVALDEEVRRIKGIVSELRTHFPHTLLSIDTFRASVARIAVEEGANMVNDISGGSFEPEILDVVKQGNVAFILMHSNPTQDTLHSVDSSIRIMPKLIQYFSERLNLLTKKGIMDVIIDPGFGFGKTIEQNFEILQKLQDLRMLRLPILVGVSRKSMIYKTIQSQPELALNGTTVLQTLALSKGCSILRVHDPKEAKEAIQLVGKLFLT
jgi:dihydropteroate synthase